MRTKKVAQKCTGGVAPFPRRHEHSKISVGASEAGPPTRLFQGKFSAWVAVEDRELEVYEQTAKIVRNEMVISGYIASEAGKNFTVHWRDTGRKYNTCGVVTIDGAEIGELKDNFIHSHQHVKTAAKNGWEAPANDTQAVTSMRTSRQFTQSLVFSQIQTTDDDAYIGKASTEKLGEIRVSIQKCNLANPEVSKNPKRQSKGSKKRKAKKPKYSAPNIPEPIHETSAKAAGHRFSLGAKSYNPVHEDSSSESEYEEKPTTKNTLDQLWHLEDHCVTFVFKYKSREQLQADRIIPWEDDRNIFTKAGYERFSRLVRELFSQNKRVPEPSGVEETDGFGSDRQVQSRSRSLSLASTFTELEYIDDPLLTTTQNDLRTAPQPQKDAANVLCPATDGITTGSPASSGSDSRASGVLPLPTSSETPHSSEEFSQFTESNSHGRYQISDVFDMAAGPGYIEQESLQEDTRALGLKAELDLVAQKLRHMPGHAHVQSEDGGALIKGREEITEDGKCVIDLTDLD